jgi:hypothetical protein
MGVVGLRNSARFQRFRTSKEVKRYFGGKTIQCLLCEKPLMRLASHLFFMHDMSAAEYKLRFGLPWSRGLTSAASHRNSGWDAKRRARARRLAKLTRFFEFAHPSSRRESPTYIQNERTKHLGSRATGFGEKFERKVRALFDKGLLDREIAQSLGVARMTVNKRSKKWRKKREWRTKTKPAQDS